MDDKTLVIWEALDGRFGFLRPGLAFELRVRMIVVQKLFPKWDVHNGMENSINP
jgi:hypothetical protein